MAEAIKRSENMKGRERLLKPLHERAPKGTPEAPEAENDRLRRVREDMQISREWEDQLRQQHKQEQGQDLPENRNVALDTIEDFRENVKTFEQIREDLPRMQRRLMELDDAHRKLIKDIGAGAKNDPRVIYHEHQIAELRRAIQPLQQRAAELWKDVKKVEKGGRHYEATYRLYMRERLKFYKFMTGLDEMRKLRAVWSQPVIPLASEHDSRDVNTKGEHTRPKHMPAKGARAGAGLERMLREASAEAVDKKAAKLAEEEAASLYKVLYGDNASQYQQKLAELEQEVIDPELLKSWAGAETRAHALSPADIGLRIDELHKQLVDSWNGYGGYMKHFYRWRRVEELLTANHRGDDVFTTESVVRVLNTLHRWEQEHKNTTIGAVLVGDPGVGKTTMIRHYLESKNRQYVYIDLSADVTRFTLFGSKSIELGDTVEEYRRLATHVEGMTPDELVAYVKEHSHRVQEVYKVGQHEAEAIFLSQLEETLADHASGKQLSEDLTNKLESARTSMVEQIKGAERREIARKFMHIAKHNGWRDGVVIAAIRAGHSIIFDEFNKMRDWSLLHSLMTAKPGESWYFADNDERIDIPQDWRMYFTANIGARHNVANVSEALASRAAGKIMEVHYPPRDEEMLIADVAFSAVDGIFQRSAEDRGKLKTLINNVHPRIRESLRNGRNVIPVSLRLLRILAEKLVRKEPIGPGRVAYIPTDLSFDEALYDTYISSYDLYEDKSNPKAIFKLMTEAGLLVSPKIDSKAKQLLGEGSPEYAEYKKRCETHEKDKTNERLAELGRQLGGISGFEFTPFELNS